MRLESFGITDVGLRRSHNEDNFFRCDEAGLYLVADGMGGHAAGEVASGCAIQSIIEFSHRRESDKQITWPFEYDPRLDEETNTLLSGVRLANQRLYGMQQERPELSGMGTTVAALSISGARAVIAHVGDSRIYRWRADKLDLLTSDHSWVNEQLQKNIITAEEARNHRYKNVITRALGNRLDLEIDLRFEDIAPDDIFLLCSDGLTAMIDDARIAEVMQGAGELRDAANRLVAAANEAGGQDNITVILVGCPKP
jgi:PPM family protein phosphatase